MVISIIGQNHNTILANFAREGTPIPIGISKFSHTRPLVLPRGMFDITMEEIINLLLKYTQVGSSIPHLIQSIASHNSYCATINPFFYHGTTTSALTTISLASATSTSGNTSILTSANSTFGNTSFHASTTSTSHISSLHSSDTSPPYATRNNASASIYCLANPHTSTTSTHYPKKLCASLPPTSHLYNTTSKNVLHNMDASYRTPKPTTHTIIPYSHNCNPNCCYITILCKDMLFLAS